jgi:hypothetical protein
LLIPRKKEGIGNEQCAMFHEEKSDRCKHTLEMFP